MVEHDRIYVYTGSETGYIAGNWYYWDGSAWTDGGVYNSTAIQTDTTLAIPGMAADAKATGDSITNLKSDLPDIAFPLSDFGNDWTGTSYSATLKKEKNVFTISGTRTSTYRAYSIMGDALVVSSNTNHTSLPDSAFGFEQGKLMPGVFYNLMIKVIGTCSSGALYSFGVSAKRTNADETTSIVNISSKPTISLTSKGIYHIPFKFDSGDQISVNFQLRSGTFTGTKFVIWIEQKDVMYIANPTIQYENVCPIMTKWKYGYFLSTGAITSQTTRKERYTPDYIPIYGAKRIMLSSWIDSTKIDTGWFAVCFYNGTTFISRSDNEVTDKTQIFDGKQFNTTSFVVPANATHIRVCGRIFGDDSAKVALYLSDAEIVSPITYMRPYRFSENATDFIDWYMQKSTKNNIKSHVGVRSINHRGWHECPENTLVAYKQSKIHGFDAGECDVRFTSDNIPVLLHDQSINRTARNADGTTISDTINISSITYEQALEYDFGIYKDSDYAGTKIPTLAQYLTLCRNIGLSPYIEVEAGFSAAKHKIIADTVISCGVVDEVTFISSDSDALINIMQYIPYARYGLIPWTYDSTYLATAVSMFNSMAEVFLDLDRTQITAEVVAECSEANVPIEAWTPNASQILALNAYVSGFTSNDAVAREVLYNSEIS